MGVIRQMLQQVETQVVFCVIAFCALSWHNIPTETDAPVSLAEFVAIFAVWGAVVVGILLIARTHWTAPYPGRDHKQENGRA